MDRESWLKKLKSKNQIQVFDSLDKEVLDRRIREHIQKNGSIKKIEGFYGDFRGATAYIEEEIETQEGIFSKAYGCSILYKGTADGDVLDKLSVLKRIAMESIRIISNHPVRTIVGKKWRNDLLNSFISIYKADLERYLMERQLLPIGKFNLFVRELIRVGRIYFRKELVDFFSVFIQFDKAYWYRLQDILMEIPEECFGLRFITIREVNNLFKILKRREKESLVWKYELARYSIVGLMILSRKFRHLIQDFIGELDRDKIKPDKADIYFTLNRRGYDFRGISFENRFKEWERINKKKGHCILGI
jgi:hypothetical protein